MTLGDFLLARIAEDEAVAQAALAPDQMHPYGDQSLPQTRPDQVPDEMRGYLGGTWGEHAARWDMTRVLAECTAKRGIITESFANERGDMDQWEGVLEWLALPYASHPDYDPAWLL